jgi:hypothetical protein
MLGFHQKNIILFKLPTIPSPTETTDTERSPLSPISILTRNLSDLNHCEQVEMLIPGSRWLASPLEKLVYVFSKDADVTSLNGEDAGADHPIARIGNVLALVLEGSPMLGLSPVNDEPPPAYHDVQSSTVIETLERLHIADALSTPTYSAAVNVAHDPPSPTLSKVRFLPPLPHHFMPQPSIEEKLKSGLENLGFACLVGEMGLGKTCMATQYAYNHQQEFEHILWLSLQSMPDIMEGFYAIQEAVNAEVVSGEAEPTDKDIRRSVRTWLHQNANYLLVIDNADDVELLKSLFDADVDEGMILKGSVIFTSRNLDIARHAIKFKKGTDETHVEDAETASEITSAIIRLESWTRLETISYLRKRLPYLDKILERPGELEAFNNLCEHFVNDYPIVIEQFASLVIQSGRLASMKTIRKRLKHSKWNTLLVVSGSPQLDSFADLFQYTLESIATQGPTGTIAILALCFVGSLAHSAIPTSLLETCITLAKEKLPHECRDVSLEDSLQLLQQSSIVSLSKRSDILLHLHAVFYQVSLPIGWSILEGMCSINDTGITLDVLQDICWSAIVKDVGTDPMWGELNVSAAIAKIARLSTPHLLYLAREDSKGNITCT